ncbi:tetratricopeptide repeat protein [Roseibium sp.]|uniref:tetratricopeptide repeat protein n=1 Tax=Roseibium sp. TaxID=1936156 RepID=UPI003A9837B4
MLPEARQAFEHALECERRGDTAAALASYLDALDHAPDDLEIAFRTATTLLREGYLEEAASQLRRIVFVDPDHVPARANLGNCQLLSGDLENAEMNFRSVLEASPDNRNALFGLASVCLKQGKYDAAREPAERLMQLLPDNAPVLTLFAQACSRDPQSSRAAAAFRQALAIDPAYLPAITGLAELSIKRKKFDDAVRYSDTGLNLEPSNVELIRFKAIALEGLGRFAEARGVLEKALSFAPANIRGSVLVTLSALCRKMDEPKTALIHAEQAWSRDLASKDFGNAVGACLKALGLANEARIVLTAVARHETIPAAIVEKVQSLALDYRKAPLKSPEETVEVPDDDLESDG